MITLSIIVPVYNIEKYLRKCLDSILSQTFQDFEVILVNDGSTDRCPEICEEYGRKDSRVQVIHKENGGLSDARNVALDCAKGKYIAFVDGDDMIMPEMYEHMIRVAEENLVEMVTCGVSFVSYYDGKCVEEIWPHLKEKKTYSRDEVLNEFFPDVRQELVVAVWNKIYIREIFKNLRFPKGKIFEDAYVQLAILEQCKNIVMLREPYYIYFVKRLGSIMNSSYNEQKMFLIDIAIVYFEYFKSKKINEQKKYALDFYVEKYLFNSFAVNFCYHQFDKEFKKYKKQFYSM